MDAYTNMTWQEFSRHYMAFAREQSCCFTIVEEDSYDEYVCIDIWHVNDGQIGYLLSKVRVVGSFPSAGGN